MRENYKHLYEQAKKMLTMYQDELIPGFRKKIEELEKQIATDNNVGSKWIPVTERMPEERNSIFAKHYGTERWMPLMFRKISCEVLAVIEYEDGTRKVKTTHTTDGEWRLTNIYGAKKITHWMPLPEAPKEVE